MLRLMWGLAAATASIAAPAPPSVKPVSSVAFTDVTVIDGTGAPAQPGMTVVVSGNRIASLARTGTAAAAVPAGARLVNGRGKYLIPGLWDMHVHLFNNTSRVGTDNSETYFPLMLANGVTSVRDMWTDLADLTVVREWNRKRDRGELLAPRVLPASSLVDGSPPFWPNSLVVSSPEEGRAAVRMLKRAGAGFIKVYWKLSPETYAAIASEAKALGIEFSGHVPFAMSAFDVSNAGQKSIEHLTGLPQSCLPKRADPRGNPQAPALRQESSGTSDAAECQRLFALYASNRTWQVPTAVLHRGRMLSDDAAIRRDARLRYVSASARGNWLKQSNRDRAVDLATRAKRFDEMLEVIKAMHLAGVPLMAGTDLGNAFVIAGFSLHDELALFVSAGLTPMQALQTATKNAALYAGKLTSLGTIEVGKVADLVLLNADPLADIRNTAAIDVVVADGRLISSHERQAMLEAAAARALAR